MRKIAFLFTPLVTVLVGLLPAVPAQALVARTFVSAAGSDSNNCANVLTPCRHLATAYAATAPEGEIYVLDPANYGSLTITGPVSIEGHGWASIAPVANGNAIFINAGPTDKINIIGVVLDGTAVTNTRGINFIAGGSLIVRDSVIRNFSSAGIEFEPTAASELSVSNTLISDNGFSGIFVSTSGTAAVSGVFDHVAIEHNVNDGIHIQCGTVQALNFTISDSVSAHNTGAGIGLSAGPGTIDVMVRNSTIAKNHDGLLAQGSSGATIWVTRTTVTGNTANGWLVGNGATVTSYVDNNIDNNTSGNGAPPSTATYK
jgi:hypothetical protein